jgi:uncharacterized SAM-binding protein YcdF (DUF218 family)
MALVGAAAAVAMTAAFVTDVFLAPPVSDNPTASQAVVVLAGADEDRLPVALRIAEQGPRILVVSVSDGDVDGGGRDLCEEQPDLEVVCLTPSPDTTRGESQAVGRLVAERGWRSITVVTSSYHVARAAVTIAQCTDADVQMADSGASISLRGWVSQVAHELGGMVQTVLEPAC